MLPGWLPIDAPWWVTLLAGAALAYGGFVAVTVLVKLAMRLAFAVAVAGLGAGQAINAGAYRMVLGLLLLAWAVVLSVSRRLAALLRPLTKPIGRLVARIHAWVVWTLEFRETLEWEQFRAQLEGLDSRQENRAVLGLGQSFTRPEFDAAFRKVQARVHPDAGGNDWLSARVNLARLEIIQELGWKK